MNRRAKFDAASFILDGEIRNRTNKQTKLQTVTDISAQLAYGHVWISSYCITFKLYGVLHSLSAFIDELSICYNDYYISAHCQR